MKDARLEGRQVSLAIMTIDSGDNDDDNDEDDAITVAPPSKRCRNRKTKRGFSKRSRYSSSH